jgi:TMEM175 potassium channel family protein
MGTNRLEAFSDGVMAVIITIMVLELKPPEGFTVAAWQPLIPGFLVYALSFVVVAILWVNHHNLLHLARHASSFLLWSNNGLLFWMSLIPFVTAYLGRDHHAPLAVAAYGTVMALTSCTFTLLQVAVARQHDVESSARTAFRRVYWKSGSALVLYSMSVPLAFFSVYGSLVIFVVFPVLYFFPERSISVQVKAE